MTSAMSEDESGPGGSDEIQRLKALLASETAERLRAQNEAYYWRAVVLGKLPAPRDETEARKLE